ncbi:MAG TPA: ABC transporter substrate-binding protein [Alphaproteobacteria bacterium]|nr:ABC transporter substrate-binding protein [Alphaproteobacteria bacterium]
MRRRAFLAAIAGAAWPFAGHAQDAPIPLVGFLRSTPAAPFPHLLSAVRAGLMESGYVDGRNVATLERYADNRNELLPGLAKHLVSRRVSVIVGNSIAAAAAKEATDSIPIVFVAGDDPVKSGLVSNLARPERNLTGITFFGGGHLNAKRLELLNELVPGSSAFGVLMDVNYPAWEAELPTVIAAARGIDREIMIVKVSGDGDLAPAFGRFADAGIGALLISGSAFFTSRRHDLVALAAHHSLPAIYDQRDYVAAGGLISYAASFVGAYHQAGVYAGRILKGAKPADLPVAQPTTFELTINMITARALGLNVPQSILIRANEVIE